MEVEDILMKVYLNHFPVLFAIHQTACFALWR